MKCIHFAILSFIFVLSCPLKLGAQPYMTKADYLLKKGGLANYKEAIELYLSALDNNYKDFELNWKLARAYYRYADATIKTYHPYAEPPVKKDWKKMCAGYSEKGMNHAKEAVEINPNRPEGYYYYVLNVGIYASSVSVLRAIIGGLKGKTQKNLEKSYQLDKMYDKAGVILGLGRFWSVLPWPWKDKKKALAYFHEYQSTGYFGSREEGPLYFAELLMQMGGESNKTMARAHLQNVAASGEKYFRNWTRRRLRQLQSLQ